MAGHAGTHSPSGVLICSDTLHVVSMSRWLGGLAVLLVVVPGGIRVLGPLALIVLAVTGARAH
jgi:putative copper export protein